MEEIIINVDKHMAAPRPRFQITGRYVRAYMPKRYTDFKVLVRDQLPFERLETPLKVEIEFHFPLLQSWSRKMKQDMIGKYKVKKPDLDNLLKTVLDAGNEWLWNDDSQIVELRTFKRFSEEPRIIIKYEEVE